VSQLAVCITSALSLRSVPGPGVVSVAASARDEPTIGSATIVGTDAAAIGSAKVAANAVVPGELAVKPCGWPLRPPSA
jgi:hypothetical protein